ncbi:MAG: hypothetical protein K6T33_06745 [Thermomonas hydrothermalis]|uniref:hypothetical protein n=1 Tax=Thermomonas hydrothermalis TaxID=213588 RepID=UPI002356B656|nr:hypothetical protein [Thermomonas hydrothermalis]MCL6619473.1 hypothetical protein [Thermomonas hydrothermalis]
MKANEVLRKRLQRILIKDEAAFEALRQRLADGMSRAWTFGVEAAFRDALETLRGIDPQAFSAADEARILSAIEAKVGGEAMRRAMEGPVVSATDAIWRVGADEAARPAGVDYAFGRKDERAISLLNRFDLHWIGRHWDAGTRETVTGAVRAFFERGWSYETLADRLRQAFAGIEDRGMVYWQLTADTIATKTREIARVGGYEQAGVRYVEVRAHLDHRTTPICRSLHGRLIPIGHIQAQRDSYLAAIEQGSMERAKQVWPMMDGGTEIGGGKVLPGNIGLPPYHFRCRTVTVAYLGTDPQTVAREADDVERWTMAARQRDLLPKRDLLRIVERAMTARWDNLAYARGHLEKHMDDLADAGVRAESLSEYNEAMDGLIRRGDRDIALSIRRSRLYAEFSRQTRAGRLTAIVNLSDGKRASLHVKGKHERGSLQNEMYAPQNGRGVKKWMW